jgi:hypothetical protein
LQPAPGTLLLLLLLLPGWLLAPWLPPSGTCLLLLLLLLLPARLWELMWAPGPCTGSPSAGASRIHTMVAWTNTAVHLSSTI